MAHQAHNLPWNTLAAKFKTHATNGKQIYTLHKPGQAEQRTYFANAFEQTIEASPPARGPNTHIHARDDQSEYMPTATLRRIERTLQKFRSARYAKLIQWGP
ncbi:hypothetical protein RJZ57_002625 [Blastomyces gilchristii]